MQIQINGVIQTCKRGKTDVFAGRCWVDFYVMGESRGRCTRKQRYTIPLAALSVGGAFYEQGTLFKVLSL